MELEMWLAPNKVMDSAPHLEAKSTRCSLEGIWLSKALGFLPMHAAKLPPDPLYVYPSLNPQRNYLKHIFHECKILFPRNINDIFKALSPCTFHDKINLDIKLYSAKKDINSQSRTKTELYANIWHHALEILYSIVI